MSVNTEGLMRSEEIAPSDLVERRHREIQRIARGADFSVGVFQNPAGAYSLVNLRTVRAEDVIQITKEWRRFLGIIGIVDGAPQTALLEVVDTEDVAAISSAVVEYIATAMGVARNACEA